MNCPQERNLYGDAISTTEGRRRSAKLWGKTLEEKCRASPKDFRPPDESAASKNRDQNRFVSGSLKKPWGICSLRTPTLSATSRQFVNHFADVFGNACLCVRSRTHKITVPRHGATAKRKMRLCLGAMVSLAGAPSPAEGGQAEQAERSQENGRWFGDARKSRPLELSIEREKGGTGALLDNGLKDNTQLRDVLDRGFESVGYD